MDWVIVQVERLSNFENKFLVKYVMVIQTGMGDAVGGSGW
jgi:hypothetical protein